ncbi:hypothetical protein BCR43DRAFT_493859 [Syncephalastrum racemosum]|uniref:G domain-containing protein n=1 Tax=Syncephalastrum racemosum TaxID=13706 RepID=A0A1X2HBA8_SYNRA|nr:hypothetical protein BCR43DRAFT_493859 [Syncephalastrum racemosum]
MTNVLFKRSLAIALRRSTRHVRIHSITRPIFVIPPSVRSCVSPHRSWFTSAAASDPGAPTLPPPESHCPGCGVAFQTTDPELPGYWCPPKPKKPLQRKQSAHTMSTQDFEAAVQALDPELQAHFAPPIEEEPAVEKEKIKERLEKKAICQRCYSLRYHSRSSITERLRDTQQYGSIHVLQTKRNPVVVVVADMTDLPFSLPARDTLPAQCRMILAVNKVDMLPSSARQHEQRLRDWIKQHAKQQGYTPHSICLISARKGWGIPALWKHVENARLPTDDVYLVGTTNVGKSALLQRLIRNPDKYPVTVSRQPGTTLGLIRIPVHDLAYSSPDHKHRYLIDTPGLVNRLQLDTPKCNSLSPVTYRVQQGKSLILGNNLARIDVVQASAPLNMTLFTPHTMRLTKISKLAAYTDWVPLPNHVVGRGHHPSHASFDLAFASIGWIAVSGRFDHAAFNIFTRDANPDYFAIRTSPMLPYEFKGNPRKFYGNQK